MAASFIEYKIPVQTTNGDSDNITISIPQGLSQGDWEELHSALAQIYAHYNEPALFDEAE